MNICPLCGLILNKHFKCNLLVDNIVETSNLFRKDMNKIPHYFIIKDLFGTQEIAIIQNYFIVNVTERSGNKYCYVSINNKPIIDIDLHIDFSIIKDLNESELSNKFKTYQLFS